MSCECPRCRRMGGITAQIDIDQQQFLHCRLCGWVRYRFQIEQELGLVKEEDNSKYLKINVSKEIRDAISQFAGSFTLQQVCNRTGFERRQVALIINRLVREKKLTREKIERTQLLKAAQV